MQGRTYNLSETQLYHMQRCKNAEAMKTGKRIPYHLQYARMVKEKQLVETPDYNGDKAGMVKRNCSCKE